MRRHGIMAGCMLVGGCLTGCAAMPQDFSDMMKVLDKAREVAKETGAAYSLELSHDGVFAIRYTQSFEFDTGGEFDLRLHGNAQTAASGNDDGPG